MTGQGKEPRTQNEILYVLSKPQYRERGCTQALLRYETERGYSSISLALQKLIKKGNVTKSFGMFRLNPNPTLPNFFKVIAKLYLIYF